MIKKIFLETKIKILFWFIAIFYSLVQIITLRFSSISPNYVTYLEMGEALLRGDMNIGLNGAHSPFYPFILTLFLCIFQLPLSNEVNVVAFANFIIFLFTLICFEYFMSEFINYQEKRANALAENGLIILPRWAWLILGYTLFIFFSFEFINVGSSVPDLLMSAFVYLICTQLFRIKNGFSGWSTYIILGLVLALGFYAKTFMFLMAFVFLIASIFVAGNKKLSLAKTLCALIVFLLVSSPFIIGLSLKKHKLTYGEIGRINYLWFASGSPKIDLNKACFINKVIYKNPTVLEFDVPLNVTHPSLYDDSNWNEHRIINLDIKAQLSCFLSSFMEHFYKIFIPQCGLLVISLTLLMISLNRNTKRSISIQWSLVIPAVLAVFMYMLVHARATGRYEGMFFLIFWLGIFSGICLKDSALAKMLINNSIIAVSVLYLMLTFTPVYNLYSYFHNPPKHTQLEVAKGLIEMGLKKGDKVAHIGTLRDYYWARLAGLKLIAQVYVLQVKDYWEASDNVKKDVINAFKLTNARAIIAGDFPEYASKDGWKRIGSTNHYVYFLK